MADKKKKQSAKFAKDKNAFAGGSSTKRDSDTKKAKQKQSGAHQPRDADVTSGHDVNPSAQQNDLKLVQPKTFGHNASPSAVQKNLKLGKKPDSGSFQENQNSFQRAEKKTSGQKTMSGQKAESGQKKRRQQRQFQKENSFTENKEKPDNDSAGSKAQDGFSKSRILLQKMTERNRLEKQGILRTITGVGTLTSRARKRADTAGGNIRTGNARKHLISGVISRQRIMISQKKMPLQRTESRNFRSAKS